MVGGEQLLARFGSAADSGASSYILQVDGFAGSDADDVSNTIVTVSLRRSLEKF